MSLGQSEGGTAIRAAIQCVCEEFDDAYWAGIDHDERFPEEFVAAMSAGGWLGIDMPTEIGGANLGLNEAAIMMQAVTESGAGFSGASSIHLNIFDLMPLVKFGTAEPPPRHLPRIILGEDRACFGVTEPDGGFDTSSFKTFAKRRAVVGASTGARCGLLRPKARTISC